MAVHTQEQETDQEELLFDQFTFTCTTSGVTSTESPVLKVIPPGVPIHFMRYGLAKKDFSDVFFYPKDKEPTPQAVDDAPFFTYYKYVRTSLREGWIYIYNECTGKMTRYETDAPRGPYILQKDVTIWAAYSEVSWCEEYSDAMCSDADKRSKRMQKISWDDWYNKQQLEHGTCVEKVDGAFYTNYEAYNFGRQHESALANEEEPDKKENLFFCLHDPMGIAYQLAQELQHQWNLMDALLISIKVGAEKDKVLECLRNGRKPEELQSKEKLEQITAMFNIAVTLKSVGLANEDNREKVWENLETERLETILATTERGKQKEKIQQARLDIKNYLNTSHFLGILDDYIEGEDDHKQFIQCSIAENFLTLLLRMPNEKDSFMDSAQDNAKWKTESDTCNDFVYQTISSTNDLGKIYDQKTTIDIIEDQANFLKFVALANSFIDIGNGMAKLGPRILETLKRLINNIRIETEEGVLDTLVEVERLGRKFQSFDHPLTEASRIMLGINKNSIKAYNEARRKFFIGLQDFMDVGQLSFTRRFEQAMLNSNKLKKFGEFQAGPFWTKFLRGVSTLNLFFAFGAIRKSGNTYEALLNLAKITNAMGDLYVAQRGVRQAAMNARNVQRGLIDAFEVVTKRYTIGVGAAGALIDTMEAGYNFWERDYDAAAFYGGAAIAGSVSAFAAYAVLVGGAAAANFWNPAGWLAAIGAVSLGFYAAYCEDSPLESYAKNCIFGEIPTSMGLSWSLTIPDVKFSGNYVQQINQHVAERNRNLLLKTGFKDWADYRKGYKDLMDLMFSGRIILKEKKTEIDSHEIVPGGPHTMNTSITSKVFSLKVEMVFGAEIHDVSHLDYHIYYCTYGVGGGKYTRLKFKGGKPKIQLIKEEDKPTKAVHHFGLPTSLEDNVRAEIVVMCRLKIDTNQYFPIEEERKPRYIASTLKRFLNTRIGNTVHHDEYRPLMINTRQKILDGEK